MLQHLDDLLELRANRSMYCSTLRRVSRTPLFIVHSSKERQTVYATRIEDDQTAQETSSLLPQATTVPSAPPLPMAHAVSSAVVVGVPLVPPPENNSGAGGRI